LPVITMEYSATDKETKEKLIKELTAAASKVTNLDPKAFTVVIHENNPDNIGVGGRLLSEIL